MPNFVFYDTETSGLSREFDQILQFAAILTDEALNEIDRFEIRCKRLPWIVPAPMAMKITGVTPEMLDDPTLPSHHEMMSVIRDRLVAWSPAIFIGYNSMRFDEPLMQRAFWQALHPPYLTVTGGNTRMDLLPIVQAASHLAEGALKYPQTAKGNTGFKLDALAPLNGFAHENAHDALADVEATIHIAKLIAERAPNLWRSSVVRSPKADTAALLSAGEPVLVVEHFMGGPSVWWGQRIDTNGTRGTNASLVRLDRDWTQVTTSDDDTLERFLAASPKPLRQLGLNKAPIIFSVEEAMEHWATEMSDEEVETSNLIANAPEFSVRVLRRFEEMQEPWPEPEHLEQRIFQGFPSRDDERLMQLFHQSDWAERAALIREFEDVRFSQLAQRIVYEKAPDLLDTQDRQKLEVSITERLSADHDDDKLWRTIPTALRELEEMGDANCTFLNTTQAWLESMRQQD